MIVVINGPCGIGKTSVAWELIGFFDRAVMLDGDYIGAVHPFEIYDKGRVDYLYRVLRHLVAFHKMQGGYDNFVINYVFEKPESLARLQALLAELDAGIYTFRLVAADDEIEQRIREREKDPAWYLQRYRELVAIQERAGTRGELGFPLDTTGLSAVQVAARIWGHLQDTVQIVPYDFRWPTRYEAERACVASALGGLAMEIHHVGSTAVPGLEAKPVIDLMATLPSLDLVESVLPQLEALGYRFVDDPENVDRRFFCRGRPRAYHLHIVEVGSQALRDHLDFRNALREDAGLRDQYAALKRTLVERHAHDRPAYSAGKSAFVQDALVTWRKGR